MQPGCGMTHRLLVLVSIVIASRLASFISLSTLAGVLVVVCWNVVKKERMLSAASRLANCQRARLWVFADRRSHVHDKFTRATRDSCRSWHWRPHSGEGPVFLFRQRHRARARCLACRADCARRHLLPLGDVICRFSPAFGQGMSVAAQEVGVLKQLIEGRALDADPLRGLAQSFFAAIQDFLAAPRTVTESDFMYEKTRGQRPNDFHQRSKFNLALQRIASEDATVHHERSEPSRKAVKRPTRSGDRQPRDGADGCLRLILASPNVAQMRSQDSVL
jgi:2-polyprenyl-6-methoxyphenol hydroxylase-like FAD-dependent oxidoreductase